MIAPAYIYRALVTRVIDADTFVVTLDLGLRVAITVHVRVNGMDAAELSTPAGQKAKAHVVEFFTKNPNILVQTYKDHMSFSRWVADVYLADGLLYRHWFAAQTL